MRRIPDLEHFDSADIQQDQCAFVFAMGFEERALAIPALFAESHSVARVVGIQYTHSKGKNKVAEARELFSNSRKSFNTLRFSSRKAYELEYGIRTMCKNDLRDVATVVVDISAMSKFLILVLIVVLLREGKRVRIVFATALTYAPTRAEYDKVLLKSGEELVAFAGQPTSGVADILRSVCLSSSRMQGQPVCAVAFTSFNEELIRHSIGTLNPHRLILVNGIPPTPAFLWRAHATQQIHQKLLDEYSDENPIDDQTGLLQRTVSTLQYYETLETLLEIRKRFGTYERIIHFATGSKMQTVALALLKAAFEDVHIEYPTPDSYYFDEYSKGVGKFFTTVWDMNTVSQLREQFASTEVL